MHFRQKGWLAIAKLRDAVKNYLAHFSAKGVLLKIKFVGNTEILKGGPLRSGLETSSTVVPLAMFKSKKTLPWFLRFYQRRSKRQTQTCSSTFCDRTRLIFDWNLSKLHWIPSWIVTVEICLILSKFWYFAISGIIQPKVSSNNFCENQRWITCFPLFTTWSLW